MAAAVKFCPPKPWTLTETETITSFAGWKSNLLYHISLNNEFERFLTSEWSKQSVPHRGLIDDADPIAEASRKTAA